MDRLDANANVTVDQVYGKSEECFEKNNFMNNDEKLEHEVGARSDHHLKEESIMRSSDIGKSWSTSMVRKILKVLLGRLTHVTVSKSTTFDDEDEPNEVNLMFDNSDPKFSPERKLNESITNVWV